MNKQVQVQRLKSHEKWRLKCLEHGIEVISPAEDYFQGCFLELRCLEQNHVTKYQTQSILVRLKKEITLCPDCHVAQRPKRKYKPTRPDSVRFSTRYPRYQNFCDALVEKGWKMVSPPEDYENMKSVMKVLCPRFHDRRKTYKAFVVCEVTSCKRCYMYTAEEVRKYISDRGATWTGPDSEYRVTGDCLSITCKCGSDIPQTFDNFRITDGVCRNCSIVERKERMPARKSSNYTKRKSFALGTKTIYVQGHEHHALNDLLLGTYEEKIGASEIRAGLTNVPSILHFWNEKPGSYTPDIFLPNKGLKGRMIEVKCEYFFQRNLSQNLFMFESTVAQGYELEVWFYTLGGFRYKKITISLEDDSFIYVTEEIEKPILKRGRPVPSQC